MTAMKLDYLTVVDPTFTWNYERFRAVCETYRVPKSERENGTMSFDGFRHKGYVGSYERTRATDQLLADAFRLLQWSVPAVVIWVTSTYARHFADNVEGIDNVEEAVRQLANMEEKVEDMLHDADTTELAYEAHFRAYTT